MKKVMRKINEMIRNAGALLGRLLEPGPTPALRPVPIQARRKIARR